MPRRRPPSDKQKQTLPPATRPPARNDMAASLRDPRFRPQVAPAKRRPKDEPPPIGRDEDEDA